MLKRLCLALAGLFALLSVAQGAGTVPGFSLMPQFDLTGKVAPGCKLYVVQAGTVSTPQNAYQDTGLTLLQPNPMTCDAAGRLPQWFVADGSIKLRLTKSDGTQIFVGDNLLVVGPSSGGGGGGSVDPTTIASTGDLKYAYGTSVLSGWVRANGRTIGSATSGATERANADCQALFSYLWNADTNIGILTVSGGRGASAAADWAANKTITLPDGRGRALAGLSDMGSTDSGILASVNWQIGGPTILGSKGGSALHTLGLSNLPTGITSSANNSISVTSTVTNVVQGTPSQTSAGAGAAIDVFPHNSWASSSVTSTGTNTITVTSTNTFGTPHETLSPFLLMTVYLKL